MHMFCIQLTRKHVYDFEFILNLYIQKDVQKLKLQPAELVSKKNFFINYL